MLPDRSLRVVMMGIKENVAQVQERIAAACRRSRRGPDDVKLLAISKTFPPECIRAAYEAGLRDFGENRVQEAMAKRPVLSDLSIVAFGGPPSEQQSQGRTRTVPLGAFRGLLSTCSETGPGGGLGCWPVAGAAGSQPGRRGEQGGSWEVRNNPTRRAD